MNGTKVFIIIYAKTGILTAEIGIPVVKTGTFMSTAIYFTYCFNLKGFYILKFTENQRKNGKIVTLLLLKLIYQN